MPIIDRQDATDVERQIKAIFDADASQKASEIQKLFVEKLDFQPLSRTVPLQGATGGGDLPDEAELVAQMDSVTVAYVPLDIVGTNRVRKMEASAAAKVLSEQLAGDLLLVMTHKSGSQLHFILPTFSGSIPTLRRMVIERDLPKRTAVQQLSNIYWNWKDSRNIIQALEAAFDVEAVTKDFFETYKRIFGHGQGSGLRHHRLGGRG